VIIVKNSNSREEHSPFVLDLRDMIEKKQEKIAQKEKIFNFFNNKQTKSTIREEKPIAEAIAEPPITPSAPKEVIITRLFEKNEPGTRYPRKDTIIIREYEQGFSEKSLFEDVVEEELEEKEEKLTTQFTPRPWHFHLNLPLDWHKNIIIYLCICLVIVLPIKVFGHYLELKNTQTKVINYAKDAFLDLKIASESLIDNNSSGATDNFLKANRNFTEALSELEPINGSLKTIINLIPRDGANLADAEYLLKIGETVSTVGTEITNAFATFTNNNSPYLTDRLSALQGSLDTITAKLNDVNNNLNKIRPEAIPTDKIELFQKIKQYCQLLGNDMSELNSLSSSFLEILGTDNLRRYLVVFQNTNEIRPTGGFMGSFALVDIDRGQIKNIEIPGGGTYDMQGSLLRKIVSPYPLHLVNSLWQMQDANWYPDFPASAQKTKWFYEESGGPTVDGVIAINSSIIPRLLSVTGPITMPDYNITLNSDNFIEETQKNIQLNKTSAKPKQLLSDLAPILLGKMFQLNNEELVNLLTTLKQSLAEKEIQMYFSNSAVEEKILSYNWGGEIKETSRDYLGIVNTNIRGGKTDGVIKQDVSLSSKINSAGEIENTLKITRTHGGNLDDFFTRESNIDYLRVYVPVGSQLVSAEGFSQIPADKFELPDETWQEDSSLAEIQGKIYIDPNSQTQINNEFGKTVFGNWLQVDPGESKTVTLVYTLPFQINFDRNNGLFGDKKTIFYSLFIQKQSGVQDQSYSINIALPDNHLAFPLYPNNLETNNSQIDFSTNLANDELIAFTSE